MVNRLQAIRDAIISTYARVAGRLRAWLETKGNGVDGDFERSVEWFEEKQWR